MTNIQIHQHAVDCAKDFKRSESALLEAIQKVDECRVFIELGYTSLHVYAVQALGLSSDQAYNYTRVARKAVEIPQIKEAIDQGILNVSNARRINAVITPENQAEWIQKAVTLPQRELEREIAAVNPQAAVKDRLKPVTGTETELRCHISKETEEILSRVRDLESQRLGRPVSLGEALNAIGKLFLEKKDPIQKAERAAVSLRAKRIKPDSPVVQRKPSAEVIHAVNLRDQGQCAHVDARGKRCGNRRWLEVHHIQPWSMGGGHTLENLVTLCQVHHQTMPGHGEFRLKAKDAGRECR